MTLATATPGTGAGGAEPPVDPTARLVPLDGLRGLAALAVLTTHVGFATGRYDDGTLGALLSRLEVGVAVFFVLSGFLLSQRWLQAAADGGPRPSGRAFLWRRALRVLPAYWLTTAAVLLLLPGDEGPWDWAQRLLLLHLYERGWDRPGLSHTWSLATEVAFYVALPALGALCVATGRRGWRVRHAVVLAGAMLALGLGWTGVAYADGSPLPADAALWLPGLAGWFGAGIALAALVVHVRSGRPLGPVHAAVLRLAAQPGSCWAAAAALLWLSATPVGGPVDLTPPGPHEAVVLQLLYLGVAVLLLLPLAAGPRDSALAAVLRSAPARRLGEASYGVFLVNLAVVEGVMALLDQDPFSGGLLRTWLLTVAGSWALAELSLRLVERPAMRLRGWVPDQGRRPRPAPPGTPA